MTGEVLKGRNGYDIPCIHTLTGSEKMVAIVVHGFGSSKESPTAAMLGAEFPHRGIGTFAFDFPAHGESPVDGTELSMEHCMDDLASAEERVRQLCPDAEIVYFGSSFGAYTTLLYLAERQHEGRRAFLRSAAVEMPLLFHDKMPEEEATLAAQGYLMLDRGYVRPLKLTQNFFADLDAHDVFEIYKGGIEPGSFLIGMVHGTEDDTASPGAARRFAMLTGAELTEIFEGDHRLSGKGMPERVTALAHEFFARK